MIRLRLSIFIVCITAALLAGCVTTETVPPVTTYPVETSYYPSGSYSYYDDDSYYTGYYPGNSMYVTPGIGFGYVSY